MRAKLIGYMGLTSFVLLGITLLVFPRQVGRLFRHTSMMGGTSLVYQIDVPPGYHSLTGHSLAEDEIAALKRRIDPDNIKDYVWRPVGTDRVEIQIPTPPGYAAAAKARDAYVEAQQALDALNIHRGDVADAIEQLSGDEQRARLKTLAGGSKSRQDFFARLLQARANVQAAHAVQNADDEARASVLYDKLLDQIEATNITPGHVEFIAEKPLNEQQTELDALKAAGASPDQLKAVDQYVAAFDAYHAMKVDSDEVSELKRDLQGSGILQFNIMAGPSADGGSDELTKDEYDRRVQELHKNGPQPRPGDKLEWFQLDRPESYHGQQRPVTFHRQQYILCWVDAPRQMKNGPGTQLWAMESANEVQEDGVNMVCFQLDQSGGSLFQAFTRANLNRPLAAILDRRVISVANIQTVIGSQGTITGDYTDAELSYLVKTLNAGSLPAPLQPEPVSETMIGPTHP